MSYKNLSNEVEIRRVGALNHADDQANVTGDEVVDMAGFDGCLFIGYVTNGDEETYMKIEGDDVDGEQGDELDDARALSRPDGTNARDEIVLAVDVFRPKQRYLRGVVIVDGTNSRVGPILALKYKARDRDVTNYVNENKGIHTVKTVSPDKKD